MPLRPAPASSVASLVVGVVLLGCGGSTKTTAGAPAGTSGTQVAVAPAGGASTKSSSTAPGTTSTGKGSPSAPKTQPFTVTPSPGAPATSPPPAGHTKSEKPTESSASTVLAACERAIAQRPGITAAIKARAKQICQQAASHVLSQSGGIEREVCVRLVNSSHLPAEAKAQALAHCNSK